MALPLAVTFAPMEAKLVGELPRGPQWRYEPKWDGFRCLAFKDGADVDLRSKTGQPFNRYFPDVVAAVAALAADAAVLDGEIVIPAGDGLSFDELLLRIHPAASRVARLSREHPAWFVAFDLLVDADRSLLVGRPQTERRAALERLFAAAVSEGSAIKLSPEVADPGDVERWFESLGAGLDGVIAKRADLDYRSGERTGMQKFKSMRTADCAVGGFRYASAGTVVGSLLLGLHGPDGALDHVGFTSNLPAADKPRITKVLESLIEEPGFTGRRPGGPSRWSNERSGDWRPLAPRLVVEVQYDHFSGGRFRHGTKFLRWRPDKGPAQCTIAEVEQEAAGSLTLLDVPARPRRSRA
jgi:ATP-dependent DNA ligase